jgi:type VI secretion system secreted protein Hcp
LCILTKFLPTSQAAVDAYLKIEGVDGESIDSRHRGWIQVHAFQNGVIAPSAGVPKPAFSDLCLEASTDKSMPALKQSCAAGRRFPSATLELITGDANRARFYQILLTNVLVSVANSTANTGQDSPSEVVCLNFEQIYWTYTEFDSAGRPKNDIKAWWDLISNTGGNNVNPILRVSASQVGSNSLQLTWPAVNGKSYSILGSGNVDGGYQSVRSVTATGDGPLTEVLVVGSGAQFFVIQQAP